MISQEEIKYIANLARIRLTAAEEKKLGKEISSMLDFIDELNRVNTENVKSLAQVTGLADVLRKDEDPQTASKEDRERLIGQAPSVKDSLVKVKGVLK